MADVLLIGGTSHTGKSTAAEAVAARIGGRVVSTDRLGRHPGRPWRITDDGGVHGHLREHFLRRTGQQALQDLLDHYDQLWPSVAAVVAEHRASCAQPLVLEGSGLLPAHVVDSGWLGQTGQALWLTSPADRRRGLIRAASRYDRLDVQDQLIIDRFVDRSELYDRWMRRELERLGLAVSDSSDLAALVPAIFQQGRVVDEA